MFKTHMGGEGGLLVGVLTLYYLNSSGSFRVALKVPTVRYPGLVVTLVL